MIDFLRIKNIHDLKAINFKTKSIKEELRSNLIEKIRKKENPFHGIVGFENSVIPEIERAILSGHNINLLGLRGQAKTSIARKMIELLDEFIPIVKGSELMDDPFNPISIFAIESIEKLGDETPIEWIHRNARYIEKLATPDVTVADLIGDVDPIKAANLKLSYADERVIHYGLIPRSNRCIFVINELPDLQARIQVALFNILQEGDIQIRGFKLRLKLDIQFIFTANPEDYTNRGSIVTPLKDRIGSQILTHYPKSIEIAKKITEQEAKKNKIQENIYVSEIAKDIIEQIVFEARDNEFVDAKSGVSARLSISAFENLLSTAELRALKNNEKTTSIRLIDFQGIIPAITGKIEMVYEGEQEGAYNVAQILIAKASKTTFEKIFPPISKSKSKQNPYEEIIQWFGESNSIDLLMDADNQNYEATLMKVNGLKKLVETHAKPSKKDILFLMELVLVGLAENSKILKSNFEEGQNFKDLFNSMMNFGDLN